ncbi:MAG: Nif11-like leader peptide family RiPP precursor [Nostoc sp.]|uniref:Nif11-like leader peptide family RiPP precursor n=1 Tax=Nostoc sp. TaxID=1180 RepID=UPI002FF58EFC
MSVESAKAFLKKVSSDSEFRSSLEGADDQARLKIIHDAGYDFTREEAESIAPEAAGGKLSEDELEAVAGGGVTTWVSAATAVAALGVC